MELPTSKRTLSAIRTTLARAAVLALAVGLTSAGGALAQSYPAKPIKIISPFSAGSAPDAFGRLIAQQLSDRLGQSVVIENRPGAGTTIGTKAAAIADPDGYTLLQANSSLSYAHVVYANAGYAPLKAFVPVASLATWSHVLVVSSGVPAGSLQELIVLAKANPGQLNIGFPLGSPPHVLSEMLRHYSGANFNSVPYRQVPLLAGDFLVGRVQVRFDAGAAMVSLIRAGKMKALAYTGATRYSQLPNVPTMIECGLPQLTLDPSDWTGIVAPAGTPADVIAKLNAAIGDSLKSPEIQARLQKLGWDAKIASPSEFAEFLAVDAKKWPPIVRAAGLKAD